MHSERLEERCLLSGYTFVKIADSTTVYSALGVPAIGGNGEVAFKGADSTNSLVLKGSGGAVTTIESSAGPLFQFGDPVINASGQVAFWAANDDPGLQSINLVREDGSSMTLVQASAAAATGEFEQLDRRPDLNDGGDVAFMGDKPETTGVYRRLANSTVTTLAQESDGYQAFPVGETFVSLNNAGGVSFNAKLTNGDKTLVRHTGGVRTNLRDASGPLDSFTRSSISEDGDVATSIISDSGIHDLTLLSGNGNPVAGSVLVGSGGAFHQFDSPNLINNDGGVAFFGLLDTGLFGIYTGTDPSANKVVQNGDMLDGKEVQTITYSTHGANANGQIAFLAAFTDGSTAVYRADPQGGGGQTPIETTTTLVVPTSPQGSLVTLTATVTPTNSSGGVPTGNVDFVSLVETSYLAIGADAGAAPIVRILDERGNSIGSVQAYATSFLGGVRVALGDVDGDGVVELITAPGPGGDNVVKIFSMSSGGDSELQFQDFHQIAVSDPLIGSRGLNVASADVNGDGFADIIVSGGPKVIVYSGADSSVLHQLTAFGTSVTDIRVAVGDVTGDGLADVIAATGPGFAPSIKVIDPVTGQIVRAITPFESSFRGGVFVASGDLNGDAIAEIIASKGPGGTPQVKIFDNTGKLIDNFMAFDQSSRAGVRVAVGDLNGDGVAEILLAPVVGGNRIYVRGSDKIDPRFYQGVPGPLDLARTSAEHVVATEPLDMNATATAVLDINELNSGVLRIQARYRGSPAHGISRSAVEYAQVSVPMDYGDTALDIPMRVSLDQDGPRHRIAATGPILGAKRDAETDTRAIAAGFDQANGDDLNSPAGDDEDGVTFLTASAQEGGFTTAIVTASAAGFLDVFVDQNRDRTFSDADRAGSGNGDVGERNEKLTGHSIPVVAGKNMIQIPFVGGPRQPGSPEATGYYIRFRISSDGKLKSFGQAQDGEVEDYFLPYANQDAPINVQLPTGNNSSPAFASYDVSVDKGMMSLVGFSSGGDRAPLFQMPFDGRQRIEIMGTPGDDTLRVDLSGSDVSFQDLHFDGGDQATEAGDGIVIIGGQRRVQDLNFEYTNFNDGVISLDSTRIEFANLEPIEIATFSDHAFIDLSFLYDARYNRLNPTKVDAELVDAGFITTKYRDPTIADIGGFPPPQDQRAAATLRGTASVNGGNFVPFEQVTFAIPTISTTLHLGDGNDTLSITSLPGAFARTLLTVRGGDGHDLIQVGPSNLAPLIIEGGAGDDYLFGGDGDDLLLGGSGNDRLDGGYGNDDLRGESGKDTLNGDTGNDSLFGGRGIDVLAGGPGDDVLTLDSPSEGDGGGGLVPSFEQGVETAAGDDGNDVINGAGSHYSKQIAGAQVRLVTALSGGAGDDTIYGSDGFGEVRGGDGNDVIFGLGQDNTIFGGGGDDRIYAGRSSDADGEDGNDTLEGGGTLSGGAGSDRITGSKTNDSIDGGSGDDTINGDLGDDTLIGDEGNDVLNGQLGDDIINGGTGNDSLDGGLGSDILHGDAGDDRIDGGDGSDELYGAEGNDVLNGQLGDDFIDGGSGNDSLDGGAGADLMSGRDGDDSLTGGRGDDDLRGDAGADSIQGGEGNDWLRGGLGNDVLNDEDGATVGSDILDGGSGNDIVHSSAGADVLVGGTGDDQLDGGIGADTISGDDGNDTIFGGDDNDSLNGGSGADQITSGNGDDSASGGDGDDRLFGDNGNDSLQGDEGRDAIDGGVGNDQLLGGEDNDTINGGQGNDLLVGDEDNDSLNGGDGNDTVFGGDDDDVVLGGTGNDSVSGDDGDDRVLGQAGNDTVSAGEGVDTIDGGTGSDVIFEYTLNATLTPTRLTLVNLDGDTEIETLRGIERASLSAAFSPAGVTLNASAFRGSVTLFGSAFNDTITSGNAADSINGGFGNDSITSGAGADTIDGGGDADTINAGDGNDSVLGGDGDDRLFGQRGRDTISGGEGNDSIEGDIATDSVAGTFGNDSLSGDAGNDTIRGGFGDDVLKGGADNDQLFGDRGNDLLNGGSGNDILEGDLATDTALAVAGNDSLTGQDGDDILRGFAGNDVLAGGNGADKLDGGVGKDTLLGGAENDIINGGADGDVALRGPGTDSVTAVEALVDNLDAIFAGGVLPSWIDEI